MNLNVSDIKTFVPAKSFETSFSFYIALGWRPTWQAEDNSLAVMELGDHRFYLQNYFQKDWAENCMLHITVDDAQAWFEHANTVISSSRFNGSRIRKPQREPYGAVVTYVWDPSGVLLHFAQFLPDTA